jgi:hypothetical protein
MSRDLLAKIEAGCYGTMKVEGGKLVFEASGVPLGPPPIGLVPSAPPLVEDNRIIDELRDELRETKERLAVLEQQVQQLFKFREAVFSPAMNDTYGSRTDFINFNTNFIKFVEAGAATYDVMIGNHPTPFWNGCRRSGAGVSMTEIVRLLKTNLRADMINHFIIRPRGTNTPDCGVVIKFIIDWMATSPNHIDITISNTTDTLAIGFVVGLCERLNPDKLSKLIITQAKMCEHTELKNKVNKGVFKKMAFDKLVASL